MNDTDPQASKPGPATLNKVLCMVKKRSLMGFDYVLRGKRRGVIEYDVRLLSWSCGRLSSDSYVTLIKKYSRSEVFTFLECLRQLAAQCLWKEEQNTSAQDSNNPKYNQRKRPVQNSLENQLISLHQCNTKILGLKSFYYSEKCL